MRLNPNQKPCLAVDICPKKYKCESVKMWGLLTLPYFYEEKSPILKFATICIPLNNYVKAKREGIKLPKPIVEKQVFGGSYEDDLWAEWHASGSFRNESGDPIILED